MLERQGGCCALCRIKIVKLNDACLDHDHKTGYVREVLCRNCNGIEGKVFNLANRAKRTQTPAWWIEQLLAYWQKHSTKTTGVFHPLHKTADEKKERARSLARKRYAAKRNKKK